MPAPVPSDAMPGEYRFAVRAVDRAGNVTEDRVRFAVVSTLEAFNLYLMPGWNLISLPIMPEKTDIEAFFEAFFSLFQVQLTTGPADDRNPAWSPDGTKIAFMRDGDIWVMNADGSGLVQLTTDPVYEDDPAWSPDGTKIAFMRSGDIWFIKTGALRFKQALKAIWHYDAATGQWLVYSPGPAPDNLSTIETGKGYWIETEPKAFKYSPPIMAGLPKTPAPVKLTYKGTFLKPGGERLLILL
jgi:hypothetical protein